MSHHHTRSPSTACIIDGDNITRGGQVAVADAARVLERLALLNTGWPVTFAMQRRQAVQYMTAYAGWGWGVRFASMAPEAADEELLEAAAEYIARDVNDLVVVSGDHAFAGLARHTRLHVCAYRGSLSNRLRLAATTVSYLDDLALPIAA